MTGKTGVWREAASLILAARSVFSPALPYDYKILCLKRSSKMRVMPSTYVFPGGVLEQSDRSLDWYHLYKKFGFSKQSFDDLRPVRNIPSVLQDLKKNELPKYISFRICAIRETFEECGILLCRNPKIERGTDANWAAFFGSHELIQWQHRVHGSSEEFLKMCYHFEIYPDVWALKMWRNWVTPPYIPVKFNTVFFLSTCQQMPPANKDGKEIVDLMWTSPARYLHLEDDEDVVHPPPQFYEFSYLINETHIENLSKLATEKSTLGCESFWPFRVDTDDGPYTILPGDDLYPSKININDSEMPFIKKLPDCITKHRIYHNGLRNELQVENYNPNVVSKY